MDQSVLRITDAVGEGHELERPASCLRVRRGEPTPEGERSEATGDDAEREAGDRPRDGASPAV
jgi:hypothetical protein